MPSNITLYKIFLASPSDVKEERQIVSRVVDEINLGNYSVNGIKLELITWETHTYPSIGVDAQDAINKQISDNYDIFIGIMWNRFGSPTGRAESGTQEEFNRAFEKYVSNPSSTEVLFYFKTASLASLNDIDLDSLGKIRTFQYILREKGVYYREFSLQEEFEQLIRLNIISVLKKFETNVTVVTNVGEEFLQSEVVIPDIEDIGYIEAIEETLKESLVLQEIHIRMTNHITILGNHLNKKTEKINSTASLGQADKMREVKKIVDQLAENMFTYCKKTQEEIPKINKQQKILVKYYYIVLSLHNSLSNDAEEKEILLIQLVNLKEITTGAATNVKAMMQSVASTPSMTNKYAKAKKETVKVLNSVASEFTANVNLLEELERSIEENL